MSSRPSKLALPRVEFLTNDGSWRIWEKTTSKYLKTGSMGMIKGPWGDCLLEWSVGKYDKKRMNMYFQITR